LLKDLHDAFASTHNKTYRFMAFIDASEPFFQSEELFFKKLKDVGYEPKTFLDIGASNGTWSFLASKFFPNAHYELFEALAVENSEYKEQLEDNLSHLQGRVRLHPIALSDSDGELDFFEAKNACGSSYKGSDNPAWVTAKHTVPKRCLDNLAKEIDFGEIDCVKIDTQGSELDIIRGGKDVLRQAGIIQVETWLYRSYDGMTPLLGEIIEELASMDFKLRVIGSPFFSQDHVLTCLDGFFCSPSVLEQLA